jgi:hypothetical protein
MQSAATQLSARRLQLLAVHEEAHRIRGDGFHWDGREAELFQASDECDRFVARVWMDFDEEIAAALERGAVVA